MRFVHINNGLGAGNIGDEIMAEAFWRLLPSFVQLEVPLFAEARRFRGQYPPQHRYCLLGEPQPGHPLNGYPRRPTLPGLLVGDTPVSDFEGSPFPLNVVGPALGNFAAQGLPVDAIAVGVDRLESAESQALFAKYYLGIRSWSVRSPACKQNLLALGVPEARIHVAADLAWLFTLPEDGRPALQAWAAQQWRQWGVADGDPLLVVNVTQHGRGQATAPFAELARALDHLQRHHGFRIAFLSNETRRGPAYDEGAAQQVRRLMQSPALIAPHEYYSPAEMVSLLERPQLVLSHRYHMTLQSLLAGVVPVAIPRGEKLAGLAEECGLPVTQPWNQLESGALVEQLLAAQQQSAQLRAHFAALLPEMRRRASSALALALPLWQAGTPARPDNSSLPDTPTNAVPAAVSSSAPSPAHILVSHLGGMGDVVLLTYLLASLRRQHPQAHLTLCIRQPWLPLVAHFPVPPDAVVGLSFDPASWVHWSEAEHLQLLEFRQTLPRADLFIAADYAPHWFSWWMASACGAAECRMTGSESMPRGILPIALNAMQLPAPLFWRPAVFHSTPPSERHRLALLAEAEPDPIHWPTPIHWAAPPPQEAQAWLQRELPGSAPVLFVFPTGAGSSPAKRWPMENYAALLQEFAAAHPCRIVLNAESADLPAVQQLQAELSRAGHAVALFAERDLTLLLAIIGLARLALGNDTGPAHLAQALAVPTVIVQGGGCWPAYGAWGPGSVSVVHPLPCFGCNWNCAFGRGLCVEAIPVATVAGLLRQVWQGASASPPPPATAHLLSLLPASQAEIMGAAAQQFQQTDQERRRSFAVNLELELALTAERHQIAELESRFEIYKQELEAARLADHALAVQRLQQRLGPLESQLATAWALSQDFEQLIAANEAARRAHYVELDSLQKQIAAARQQLRQEQLHSEHLQDQLAQLTAKTYQLERSIQELVDEDLALRGQLSHLREESLWDSVERHKRKLFEA